MADLTLNEKFQKLTGINAIDIEEYINNAEDKKAAFAKLQWLIPHGQYTDADLIHDDQKESLLEKVNLFAEVLTEVAEKTNVPTGENPEVDLNENDKEDTEDKIAKAGLSEAYAIINGYDSEDEEDNSSN